MDAKLKVRPVKGYLPGLKRQFIWIVLQRPDHFSAAENKLFTERLQADYLEALHLLGLDFLANYPSAPVTANAGQYEAFLPFHEGLYAMFVELVSAIHRESIKHPDVTSGLSKSALAEIIEKLKGKYLDSKNRNRRINAMVHDDIPSLALMPGIIQIGWGRNARLMDTGASDKTRALSISLAGNKKTTSELLRIHGLPASDSIQCTNESDALKAAKKIGFPVVVKPADFERGIGVHALIDSEERLLSAFRSTSKLSSQVLVEKHFHGLDYRIQVFEGVAYSVTQRSPGGVTGDGLHTVEELLAQMNADRRHRSDLRQLTLDDDATNMLARQKMRADSVPSAGQFVTLRSIANVDRGGTSVQVIDKAHPDNLALAAQAAQVLNLDIAGIDLLISDISKSWREVGALICEVNARPMINTAAIGRLLRMMSPQGYRIPSILLVKNFSVDRLVEGSRKLGPGIGIATPRAAWIDGMEVCRKDGFADNGRSILLNRNLRAFIHCITPEEMSREKFFGFPCDRYDLAVIPREKPASMAVEEMSSPMARYAWLNLEKVAGKCVYAEEIPDDLADWALNQLAGLSAVEAGSHSADSMKRDSA